MDDTGHRLAATYLQMLNQHDPDLVDGFVARDYRNHNTFVDDGREANRRFWAGFFAALPDLTATMEDLVVAGDRVVGRFVYRGTHQRRIDGVAGDRAKSRDALHRHLAGRRRHVRRALGRAQHLGATSTDRCALAPARRAVIEFARVAALIGVLGTAVVFGTDVFCAMVQRPALAHVDDRALVAVMGYVHRYGDRRMPIPGVIGLVATAASAVSRLWPGAGPWPSWPPQRWRCYWFGSRCI